MVVWVRGDLAKADGHSRNGQNRLDVKYIYLSCNHPFIGIESKRFDESLLGSWTMFMRSI